MKNSVFCLVVLAITGCANTHSSYEEVSTNEFKITASGPADDGKAILEKVILKKASELCKHTGFKLKATGLGEDITFSGITEQPTKGSWHGNSSNTIQAVATVICTKR